MKDIARLYVYIIGSILIGCITIMLCWGTYYIINDKDWLFEFLGHIKIALIAAGFYWLVNKFMSKSREK